MILEGKGNIPPFTAYNAYMLACLSFSRCLRFRNALSLVFSCKSSYPSCPSLSSFLFAFRPLEIILSPLHPLSYLFLLSPSLLIRYSSRCIYILQPLCPLSLGCPFSFFSVVRSVTFLIFISSIFYSLISVSLYIISSCCASPFLQFRHLITNLLFLTSTIFIFPISFFYLSILYTFLSCRFLHSIALPLHLSKVSFFSFHISPRTLALFIPPLHLPFISLPLSR